MELFSLGKIGKTALSQEQHNVWTPNLHQCVTEYIPVDSCDPHIIGLLYGDVKANKRQNSLFCQSGKDPGQNSSTPLSDQSSYGDKNQAWKGRILGLSGCAGILQTTASGKEQEMVYWNTCNLSDLWYYQTCSHLHCPYCEQKCWLGAIFWVAANLGPCYISVLFTGFCHCFVSLWECLIGQGALWPINIELKLNSESAIHHCIFNFCVLRNEIIWRKSLLFNFYIW